MLQITRNGIKLNYVEAGSGGPPLFFVHGFGGSTAHFEPQLEHFKRKHRVVAIDRRGHGDSDKPEGPYTIPAIAEEVAWTARELGLHRPVLVVHSMGPIGLEATLANPDQFSALIIIDAPAFPPPPVLDAFAQLGRALRSPGYGAAIDALCQQMIFLPTDDKDRRAKLHNALMSTPQHVLASTWEGFLAYDPTTAASRLKLPVLYIGGVMPADEARMRALMPQVMIGRYVGAGHFGQVEVPAQVNAMIEKFLQLTGPK